jgi:DNA recombination protein RmuC
MKTDIIFLSAGLLIGGALTWLLCYLFYSKKNAVLESGKRSQDAVNEELRNQIETLRQEAANLQNELNNESQLRAAVEARYHEAEKNFQAIEKKMLDQFSSLSLEALSKNSAEFLKLAEEHLKSQSVEGTKELEHKKKLIEKSLQDMDRTLADVRQKIEDVSRGNVKVSSLMENHEKVTARLRETTEHLRQALASSKKRGEWGERMAEDIINLVGMVEGVNYVKQKTLEGSSGRPDYTFFLPNKLKINMDVKFPLDNYVHYLDADNENERKRFRDELVKNARVMIKQVTTRDYINPTDNTVDYVIVFIPNEQVYSFIHESDSGIMDEALRQKVIMCSPFTLYAVLAVIRQAVENFNFEKTASEIEKLLSEFFKQWKAYKEKFKAMGDKLDAARKEYDVLVTTRSNMLERPLKKIDDLRRQRDIVIETDERGDGPLVE